jgi:hypothetical protein
MSKFKVFVLIAILFFQTALMARVVNEDEAITVSLKLIQFENQVAELRLTKDTFSFKEITPLVYQEEQIGYIVHLLPRGFMIFPGITELSPAKFVCFSGNYEEIKDHPFIRKILERIRYTRVRLNYQGESKAAFLSSEEDPIDTIQAAENEGIWEKYFLDEVPHDHLSEPASLDFVPPMLTSKWNQGTPYNMYTPTIFGYPTPTGCVATAQAQVMYYWKYPTYGQGSHSYTWWYLFDDTLYSQDLNADFDHEYYWDRMVDEYDGTQTFQQEDAVARLMSDVGISLDMDYGIGGSGVYELNCNDSLQTFFKYSTDIQLEDKFFYTWNEWFDMFKQQMDKGWPAMLATFNSEGGHAIVIDGYRTLPDNEVHVNLGWGGCADGYYSIDDIYGYGDEDWDSAVINIHPPKEIIVITPNGGEHLQFGSEYNITWDAQGVGDLKITLWQGGSKLGTIADDVSSSLGYYNWEVGEHSNGTASPGSGYKIKISEKGTAVSDTSDAPFNLTGGEVLTVTAPNGGEDWLVDSLQVITWNAQGVGDLRITLWQGTTKLGIIADNISSSPGSYAWIVGQHSNGTAFPGPGYKIKISEKGTTLCDTSDDPFNITGVTVISPNGGENWEIGSLQDITWAAYKVGDLKITLWQGETKLGTIEDNISSSLGSYNWEVGKHSNGTASSGSGYTIKISEKGTPVADTSNSPFSLY